MDLEWICSECEWRGGREGEKPDSNRSIGFPGENGDGGPTCASSVRPHVVGIVLLNWAEPGSGGGGGVSSARNGSNDRNQ